MENQACEVLNALFWKVPRVVKDGDADTNARWWIAELEDKGIRTIWWNPQTQCFEVK